MMTISETYEEASDLRDYDYFASRAYLLATLCSKVEDLGFGNWVVREIEHEPGSRNLYMYISRYPYSTAKQIGIWYYPEGVSTDSSEFGTDNWKDDTEYDLPKSFSN